MWNNHLMKLGLVGLLLLLFACRSEENQAENNSQTTKLTPQPLIGSSENLPTLKEIVVKMEDPSGKVIGQVRMRESEAGLTLNVEMNGLDKGWYAFHLHETGDCSDAFNASGGHFNPTKQAHGFLHPEGPHAGDFPNIYSYYRQARAEFFSNRVSFEGLGGRPALLDDDAFALVVHEGADDHLSQPSGGGGTKIACGSAAKQER